MKKYRIKEYPEGEFIIQAKSWIGWTQIIQTNFRGQHVFIKYSSLDRAREGLDSYIYKKNFKPKYVY